MRDELEYWCQRLEAQLEGTRKLLEELRREKLERNKQ